MSFISEQTERQLFPKEPIRNLVRSLERKDRYTASHSRRVRFYVSLMLEGLNLPLHEAVIIQKAALLHDIGKLVIDLTSLHRIGKLTTEEIYLFRLHPVRGRELLEIDQSFHPLLPLIYHHHERFDGRGYPDGLAGEEIPLGARLIAIADSFDAMVSHRVYRKALTPKLAIEEIHRCAGTQFDPNLAQLFVDQLRDHISQQPT